MMDEASYQDYFQRSKWVRFFFGALFLLILARSVYLQVGKGEEFYLFSRNNQLRKERVHALRGLIYDREMNILADYRFRFDVVLIPQYVLDDKGLFNYLSRVLNKSEQEIANTYTQKKKLQPKFQPITIARNVSDEIVATIEVQKKFYHGVDVHMVPTRYYPYNKTFSHVLGYVAEASQSDLKKYKDEAHQYQMGDLIGRKGVERNSETYLRGNSGIMYTHVDAHGRRLEREMSIQSFWSRIKPQRAVQGQNILTTLDLDIQRELVKAFGEEKTSGAGVVLEIHTGKILALASLPSFDPNLIYEQWPELIADESKPLLNRAIQGVYPPGSTYKIITALAGLHTGSITPDLKVKCRGHYRLGRRVYSCWKRHGHGSVNLYKAIVQSCDVFFYRLGRTLGIDVLSNFTKRLGFGQSLEVSLLNERAGIVPTSKWKEQRFGEPWMEGETLSVAIGQGYLGATPIQIASAIAAILNGGTLYRPYVVEAVLNEDSELTEVINEPKVLQKIELDPEHVNFVREAMVGVMSEKKGTGYYRRSRKIDMGGKTGTSQVKSFSKDELFMKCEELPYEDRHHALFVGFWPADNPRILSVAVREHGCSGSKTALPIVRSALETAAEKFKPKNTMAGEM